MELAECRSPVFEDDDTSRSRRSVAERRLWSRGRNGNWQRRLQPTESTLDQSDNDRRQNSAPAPGETG
jgi:hypothetical protein